MARDEFVVEEIGYPPLETAQDTVIPVLANALTAIIRSRLDTGEYIAENGFVKLREEVKDE